MLGLILIALGTGGIKPCVAAFGGDQFEDHQACGVLYTHTHTHIYIHAFNRHTPIPNQIEDELISAALFLCLCKSAVISSRLSL